MGDGTQPQQAPGAQQPQLPPNAPKDLQDFVSCKSATYTLKNGKVTWLSIKPRDLLSADMAQYVPDAVLDTSVNPSMTISPDSSAPGTASIRVGIDVPGLGTVGPSFTASVKDGSLNVDSSGVPAAAKGPLDDAVKNLNDWLKANGKGFGAPAFGKDEVKLSKVDIAVPQTAPPPAPAPTPDPKKQEPLKGAPGKGAAGGGIGAPPPAGGGIGTSGPTQADIDRLTKARNDAYGDMNQAATDHNEINDAIQAAKQAGAPIDPGAQARLDAAGKKLSEASSKFRQAELDLEKACKDAGKPTPALPGTPSGPDPKTLGRADTDSFPGQTAEASAPVLTTRVPPLHEPPPEPAGYHIFPVNEPPPLDERAVQANRFPTVQVAIGGAIVLGAIVIGGIVFANQNGGAAPATTPTPSQLAQGATPTPVESGSSSPSVAPSTATNPLPPEVQALTNELVIDVSTTQKLPAWWQKDPTGDLQEIDGKPGQYTPPFADITGWVALEDDAVKPGALAALAGKCGKTDNGFQFVCGTKTAAAIQANPILALLAVTEFAGPFPQGYPQRSTSQCDSQICGFVVQLLVDRDGNAANNVQAPPGQPNDSFANADGFYTVLPISTSQGPSMKLISVDLAAHKTADTSALMVVGQRTVAYVLFDIPKALRVSDQAEMLPQSSGTTTPSSQVKMGFDVWGAFPPMNVTTQKAPLFWGRTY